MAVNEIFELNSMFIGDDRERNELEQRSRTLRTGIDQQEGRFLSEIDKMDEFRKDVKDFDESLQELDEAIDVVYATTNTIDPNNEQYIRQLRDCLKTRSALRQDVQAVQSYLDQAIHKLQSYSRQGPVNMFREGIAMSQEDILSYQVYIAQSQEYQQASHHRLSEQRTRLEELAQSIATVAASKETILSSMLALQDEIGGLEAKSVALQVSMENMQLACETDANNLQEKYHTLQAEHTAAVSGRQNAAEQLHTAQQQRDQTQYEFQDHKHDHQELEKENHTLTKQHHDLLYKHSHQHETNSTLRGALRVLKEENLLLKSQETAIRQHTFTEKLELLSFETEELLSNIQEIQLQTEYYRSQLSGVDHSSPIHALLQQIAESQARRKETIEKRKTLQHELEMLLVQGMEAREAEENHIRQAKHEVTADSATLQVVKLRARESTRQLESAPTMNKIMTTLHEQTKSLTQIQSTVEDQIKSVALKELDLQHALQRLHSVQDEFDMQQESNRVTAHQQEKRLRLKRMQEKRLSEYMKTIQEHESELKNENDRFQSSLLHQEELLQKRRDLLITQLESVTKLTKQPRTAPSSPDCLPLLQQQRQRQPKSPAPPIVSAAGPGVTKGPTITVTGRSAVDRKRKRDDVDTMTAAVGVKRQVSQPLESQQLVAGTSSASYLHRSEPQQSMKIIRADEQATNMTASEAFDFFVRPNLPNITSTTATGTRYQRPPIMPPSLQRNAKRALEGSENVDSQTKMATTSAATAAASTAGYMLTSVTPMAERGVKPTTGSSSANKNKAKMRAGAGPKFGT